MTAHTPGPWVIRRLSSTIRLFAPGASNAEVCGITKSRYIDAAKARKEADATVIAAAPDMLAILIRARDWNDACDDGAENDDWQKIMTGIRAAIAKATGGGDGSPDATSPSNAAGMVP